MYKKTFLLISLFIIITQSNCDPFSFNVLDIKDSAINTAASVAGKIPDVIPTPDAIFLAGKNVLAGYPFVVIFEAINKFCQIALSEKNVKPKVSPDLEKLKFLLITKVGMENYTIPLQQPERLWAHPKFNTNWNTTILVTGWNTNYEESTNSAMEIVAEAYLCRGNINFVVIDTAEFLDTLYTWSAFNTEDLAKLAAVGLTKLSKNYNVNRVHLIGHSLGAHVVGGIGKHFYELTGKLLCRITGLDPAKPCFNEGEQLTGLGRGDAEFVDVIHSNPSALGKRDPIGDADFYPNGFDPLPPGCLTVICAHSRAYEFYAETVYPGNEYGFMGVKCGSLTLLNTGFCTGHPQPMGYAVPFNTKGNYFLATGGSSPYGVNTKPKSEIQCNDIL